MLNPKTRLEDDLVLFSKMNKKTKVAKVRGLNNTGIFTIEDFINTDSERYTSKSRKVYTVMANIYRYAYLDQDLIYDIGLFEKEYDLNEYINKPYNMISYLQKDISKLGFELEYYRDNIRLLERIYQEKILRQLKDNKFSMKTVLAELCNYDYNSMGFIASFYLDYINKKETKLQDSDDLLDKYNNLIKQRDELNKQIKVLEEQINYKKLILTPNDN